METFGEKLKSWKRWMAVLAAIAPIIGEVLTGAMGWATAIPLCVAALLGGMGIIAVDDVSRRKADVAIAAIEMDAKKNG